MQRSEDQQRIGAGLLDGDLSSVSEELLAHRHVGEDTEERRQNQADRSEPDDDPTSEPEADRRRLGDRLNHRAA